MVSNITLVKTVQHDVSITITVPMIYKVNKVIKNSSDLVYKFKKLIGINDFSFQFGKIITRYRRIGYNLNVMRQSACLVFNPIMVDNYAAFFNCTPVGRESDSMMAPT